LTVPSTATRGRAVVVAVGVALGLLAAVQTIYFERGIVPGDAFVYLAAGERLNAGHQLYALQPGDRPVEIKPPDWTVPLVSPPPIAVLWRPLAVLPGELGVWIWYAAQLLALAGVLVAFLRRVPLQTSFAIVVLVIPTVYEIGVGNVNSFLLLGMVLVWRSATSGRDTVAGAIGAAMTAVKLTPAVTGWWLLMTGRLRGFSAFVVGGLAILAVSVIGAGLGTHIEYLRILSDRSVVGVSPISVGGLAAKAGVPAAVANLLPTLCAAVGMAAMWMTRRDLALSYRISIITMIAGSPAVQVNWLILLYAVLAPTAWPRDRRLRAASEGVDRGSVVWT